MTRYQGDWRNPGNLDLHFGPKVPFHYLLLDPRILEGGFAELGPIIFFGPSNCVSRFSGSPISIFRVPQKGLKI